MSSEAPMVEVVEMLKDTKTDKAAKNLKPVKAGRDFLATGTVNRTRPPSSVSMTHSMGTSHSRQEMRRAPEVAAENTYKMAPDRKFPEGDVRLILEEILTDRLAETKYDAEHCRQLSKSISDTVKNRVKELKIERYKIICLVHIGQMGNQGMRIGSRCLWDTNFDTYSSFVFKNGSLFAAATVYGVYFE